MGDSTIYQNIVTTLQMQTGITDTPTVRVNAVVGNASWVSCNGEFIGKVRPELTEYLFDIETTAGEYVDICMEQEDYDPAHANEYVQGIDQETTVEVQRYHGVVHTNCAGG